MGISSRVEDRCDGMYRHRVAYWYGCNRSADHLIFVIEGVGCGFQDRAWICRDFSNVTIAVKDYNLRIVYIDGSKNDEDTFAEVGNKLKAEQKSEQQLLNSETFAKMKFS